jgi:hypothetical protein
VAKGIMVVQSAPVDPAREDEFNDWYTNKHIPEVCAVPGFTGARRYKVLGDAPGETPMYLTIYEIEADDIMTPLDEWRTRSASGLTTRSDTLRLDPPPVVTFYQQIE